jgi:hypothetical protein
MSRRDPPGFPDVLRWWRRRRNSGHQQDGDHRGFLAGEVGSNPPPPRVPITPVFVSDPHAQSIHIPISINATEGAQIVDTLTLVDSGATGSFINRDLVQKRKIPMLHLPHPLQAQNIDGTQALSGTRF